MTQATPAADYGPGYPRVLRWVVWASLIYAGVILAALLIRPTAPGIFASGTILAGRWLSALNGLFTIGVALLVMRRVPGNACGPFLLLWGVGVMGWSQPTRWGSPALSTVMVMLYIPFLFTVAFPALAGLLYVFPTGRVAPPWLARPLAVVAAVIAGLSLLNILAFDPIASLGTGAAANPVYMPAVAAHSAQLPQILLFASMLLLLGAVVSLVWRYRHAGFRERQQIKFMAFGFGLLIAQSLLVLTLTGTGVNWDSRFEQARAVLGYLFWQAMPAIIVAVTIARYRLWDIDLVIRRTVSYAILTALLLLVYFGSIIVLQQLFMRLTGEESTLATILSTLLIAALFLPLRRRVQDLIDRRFYRRKYDAAKVLERFAATARDETDLDTLAAELLAVIQETMQPQSASLWLKPAADDRRRSTDPRERV